MDNWLYNLLFYCVDKNWKVICTSKKNSRNLKLTVGAKKKEKPKALEYCKDNECEEEGRRARRKIQNSISGEIEKCCSKLMEQNGINLF